MKLLFVHDHRFYSCNDMFYSSATFPSNIWERYLSVFDEIIVVGRGGTVSNIQGLTLSSCQKVSFKPFYDISGGADYLLKKEKIKEHLTPFIIGSAVVVVRLPSFFGSCAVEICQKIRKPYVVELVGCAWDSHWHYGSLLGKLRAVFSYSETKKAVKQAVATIYVTKHHLQKMYPTKARVVSYASNVYIEDFDISILKKHQIRLRKCEKVYRLGLLANIQVKYKGFEVAFKALQLVKTELEKPVELYLYGAGDLDYIAPLIRKYKLEGDIKVMGLLKSGQEVCEALDNLDIYIQPSLTEGLPRALIEAMSRGCPALASSAGGTSELLEAKYLHRPGDHKLLAEQLIFYLSNRELLLEMSAQNFYKAKEYTASILNERRTKFWQEVYNLLLE